MKNIRLVVCLLVLTWFSALNAEQRNDKQQSLLNKLKIQLNIEQASGLINSDYLTFERNILIQEKIVLLSCMPNVHIVLSYSPQKQSNECQTEINTLLTMQKNNQIGICAKFGLASKECTQATALSYIDLDSNIPYDLKKKNNEVALDLYVSQVNIPKKASVYSLKRKAESSIERYRKVKNQMDIFPAFMDARQIFYQYIPVACQQIHNHLVEEPSTNATKTSRTPLAQPEDSSDELREAWKKLEENRKNQQRKHKKTPKNISKKSRDKVGSKLFEKTTEKTPKLQEKKLYRVRFMSKDCQQAIALAYRFQKNLPLAVCYREGFSSQRCISLILNEKAYIARQQELRAPKDSQKRKKHQDGLATF